MAYIIFANVVNIFETPTDIETKMGKIC